RVGIIPAGNTRATAAPPPAPTATATNATALQLTGTGASVSVQPIARTTNGTVLSASEAGCQSPRGSEASNLRQAQASVTRLMMAAPIGAPRSPAQDNPSTVAHTRATASTPIAIEPSRT